MSGGDHRIIAGDCLGANGRGTLLPEEVDVFITDPPYSEHVHTKSRRGLTAHAGEISAHRELGFDHLDDDTLRRAANLMGTAVRRWCLVFCDAESIGRWRDALAESGLEPIRVGAWVKIGGAPQFTGDRPAVGFEAIVIAHRAGKKRWNGGGRPAVYQVPTVVARGDGTVRLHTAQKPEALMEALVKDFSEPGELICDPFAGSGTTGVAAKKWGRRFIGWEKDSGHAAAAQARIDATVSAVDDVDEMRRLTARPRKLKQKEWDFDAPTAPATHKSPIESEG